MLKDLRLTNFKAFEDFTISFGENAVIIGANNAGKTTIISAVKACARMLAIARRVKPSEWRNDQNIARRSYPFIGSQVTLVEENLRHEFRRHEVRLQLRFRSESRIVAVWSELPADGSPTDPTDNFFYVVGPDDVQPSTPTAVRAIFPSVGIIPVLYPIELTERLLDDQYVRSNMDGRLSSRHFRNHLALLKAEDSETHENRLQEFFAYTRQWLPELEDLELRTSWTGEYRALDLFFREAGSRSEREMVWAGDGLQVWLQLLAHVFRLRGVDTILLDEPDLYLHADLQRKLIHLLEEVPAQTVTATHSSEMLAEASASSITWVDKSRKRALRRPRDAQLSALANELGSAFNLHVAKALRSKVAFFVEGADMRIIRSLARKVGAGNLAAERNVAIVKLEGFSNWDHVQSFKWLIDNLLEGAVDTWVVLDRDYRPDDVVAAIVDDLGELGVHSHVWHRKELENYLLEVPALARTSGASEAAVEQALLSVTDSLRNKVYSRLLAERTRATAGRRESHETVIEDFSNIFDRLWREMRWRLDRAPGKEVLSAFNRKAQDAGWGPASSRSVAQRIRQEELASEVVDLLLEIDHATR